MSSNSIARNILVVDGCQVLPQELLQESLTSLLPFSCTFTCIPEYIEAFELLRSKNYDLLICVLKNQAYEPSFEEKGSPPVARGRFTVEAFLDMMNTFQLPLPNTVFIVEDAAQVSSLPFVASAQGTAPNGTLLTQVFVWERDERQSVPVNRLLEVVLAGVAH